MAFELPDWLHPRGEPYQALLQGTQVGLAMGQAIARNMQAYALMQQSQQRLDLQAQEIATLNEGRTLQNEIAKTKEAHDAEDYATLRAFLPKMESATSYKDLAPLSVPQLHNTTQYLQYSLLLDKHKTDKALGEMAGELAGKTPGNDEYLNIIHKWSALAPDIVHTVAYDHLLNRDATARIQQAKLASTSALTKQRLDILQQNADTLAFTATNRQLNAEQRNAIRMYHESVNAFKVETDAENKDRLYNLSEGRLQIAKDLLGLKQEAAYKAGWVSADKDTGLPAYYLDAEGKPHFPPRNINGQEFKFDEAFTPSGLHLIHTSPQKWQVVDKPLQEGKFTDVERETRKDLAKQRQTLLDSMPATAPTDKDPERLKRYQAKFEKISQLTEQIQAINDKAEHRSRTTAPTVAPITPPASPPPPAAPPPPSFQFNWNPNTGGLEPVQ